MFSLKGELANNDKEGYTSKKNSDIQDYKLSQKSTPMLENRKRKAAQEDQTHQPKHSKSTSRNIDEMQLFLEKIRSKSDKNIAEFTKEGDKITENSE